MIEIVPNWHPIWVHFTIGLLLIGTLFYAIALAGASQNWSYQVLSAARWNLLAGLLFAVLALVTGWLAANSVAHDDAGHANMMVHRNWALLAATLFIVAVIWLSTHWRNAKEKASVGVLALLLAGSAALGVTGFKGGANVYEHGLGVQRLPDLGAHDHAAHGHDRSEPAGHEHSTMGEPAPPANEHDDSSEAESHDHGAHVHSDGSEHHH